MKRVNHCLKRGQWNLLSCHLIFIKSHRIVVDKFLVTVKIFNALIKLSL